MHYFLVFAKKHLYPAALLQLLALLRVPFRSGKLQQRSKTVDLPFDSALSNARVLARAFCKNDL